jgi:hypothetical protein
VIYLLLDRFFMLTATHGILSKTSTYTFISGASMITYWDIQNSSSYSGSGTTITDLDSTNNGLLVGTNSFTNASPKYLSLDLSASNYLRSTTNLNSSLSPANTSDNISVFVWCYPTSNGVIVSELGSTTPNSGWYLSTIEWVSGTPRFGVFPYSNITNVKIYSTHGGNGSTSQYGQYPTITSDFDKLFNTAYSNTTLAWEGTMAGTTSLNHSSYVTLTNAGATVPNGGDFFSVEVSATFIPAETGTYSFGVNSDDGGDVFIGGSLVTSYYGGHGMSGPVYGNVSLTAGIKYSFRARYQEYGGGEGLIVVWKRPSQGTYSFQSSELNPGSTITSSVSASLNTWHYVGYTYNGTSLNAYVNGQSAGSSTRIRQTPYNTLTKGLYYALGYPTGINMGSGAGANFRFGAFHVWNDAISSDTILNNYNATKASYGK